MSNVFATGSSADGGVAAGAFAPVDIRRIRLTVYEVPGTKVLFQKEYDVDPTQTRWTLPFTVPAGSTVRIVAELMSVTGGVPKVEYSGQAGPVTINRCTTACAPIPVPTYPGTVENLGATSVTIASTTGQVYVGEGLQLSATALPAGPSYQQVWTSRSPAVVTVSPTGMLTGVGVGTSHVVVAVGPRRDSVLVTVQRRPRTLTAVAGNAQTAAAGTAVAVAPSVSLRFGAGGGPVAGETILFDVVSGGGSVTGASATTNAEGVATVGSWTLGTTPGANVLRARTTDGELDVTFTATAVAGPASAIAVSAGDNQTAAAGAAVATAPSVRVTDVHGNAVANAAVTFSVLTGGGTVSGANATTNAQGIATVGSWTLGTTAGANTLRAALAGTAASVTFTATATTTTASCVEVPYTLGTSVNGEWTTSDCLAATGSGRRFDMYAFTATQQVAFRAAVTGSTGRRLSVRRAGTDEYVQLMAGPAFMSPTAASLEARYVLAPGSYVIEIANQDAGTLGTYTLSTSFDATASCNPLVFVTLGVTISERLEASDCNSAFSGKEDWYLWIAPRVGERVDLTLSTPDFAPVLVFRDDRLGPASPTLTSDIRFNVGETARTAYTTTFTGFHEIVVNNATAALGAYTLNIGTASASNTCVPSPTSTGGRLLAVWEATDCQADGRLFDTYPFTVQEQTALRATLASTAAPKTLGVFTAGGAEVLNWERSSAGDLQATWFLAPGSYQFRAGAPTAAANASYTLERAPTNGDITCANNATTGNVSFTNQQLAPGDCSFQNSYEDRMFVFVEAGRQITASLTTTVARPRLIIRDPASTAGTWLAATDRADPGQVSASWTAAHTGYYQVIFRTVEVNASTPYSAAITVN